MIIVGGTYYERCEFPFDERLRGPGLRAIAAIQEITSQTNELYTCVGTSEETKLEMEAATYGFTSNTTTIPETVTFEYLHNHSNPTWYPSNADTFIANFDTITGDAVLRFGFVEGTSATVDASRVVYDPQSTDPVGFHENGSTADELAIVLNQHEAQTYTGEESLDEMLTALTTGSKSADVALIKCGTSGAVLRVNRETREIPVYETPSVWNIGSGDVFTATFAAYWADQKQPALEAAQAASLATAYYCHRRVLPIPEHPEQATKFEYEKRTPTIDEAGPTVYLAGPFFGIGDLWLVEEVQRILQKEGATVISPYHDVGRAENFESPREMAAQDLSGVEQADVVFALIDHCDPGTHFELGYASDLDIPVVAYANKPEQHQLTMLEGAGCEIYGDLSTAVFKALWAN